MVRWLNLLTEGLLYFLVIFTPWAFGTTQPWSVQVMRAAAFCLGGLLVLRWILRRMSGTPEIAGPRQDGTTGPQGHLSTGRRQEGTRPAGSRQAGRRRPGRSATMLAGLTVAVLVYCLVSALNARATYNYTLEQFDYHPFLPWLPHSYESQSTWAAFWNYLAMACVFWSVRCWILEEKGEDRSHALEPETRNLESETIPKNEDAQRRSDVGEHKAEVGVDGTRSDGNGGSRRAFMPTRMRRLLWVLCLNGALLGVMALLQRITDTNKLLWLVEPGIIKGADGQFGPYAYRSNAAQYFNLLWPAGVGFWWAMNRLALRGRREGEETVSRAYGVILPCALLMAACAIVTLSRGGVLVSLGQMLVTTLTLLLAWRRRGKRLALGLSACLVAAAGLAASLQWPELVQRFGTVFEDRMSGRLDTYELALRMAKDFPVYGSGPNTFAPLLGFYLGKPDDFWMTQLHNDWLETFITFGGVGMGLILAALVAVFWHYFAATDIPSRWPFLALIWIGLAGCLAHGFFDFPFQVPSILLLFVVLCGLVSCLSRRGRPRRR